MNDNRKIKKNEAIVANTKDKKFDFSLSTKIKNQRQYFRTSQQQLLKRSLEMVKYSAIATIILFSLFELYCLTIEHTVNLNPLFWGPCLLIILFWPLGKWCLKKGYHEFDLYWLPALLQTCVMIYCIVIDVFPFPDKPDVFMSKVLLAAPFLYYIPFLPQFLLTTFGYLGFLVVAYVGKTEEMFISDAYSVSIAYIAGLLVAVISLSMRFDTQEAEEARHTAEYENLSKTSFLFNMSHDIRTPMNAIMGFRDLLEKHQDEPDKRADYLKKIEESSNVLLSIINNVLEMARIEKGTIEIDESAWSAEQFNDTLYSIFHEMMQEKSITFTRQIDVVHPYVYCDPIKLREVFINILSNAYKYTNAGGTVHMHLQEVPSNMEGYAMYQTTITDTGIGMSKEFIPHIFEEFSREKTSTENKIEGTGLGMPIVKRLVEFMNGTIEVKSEKGVGSSFTVTIPHRIAEKESLVELAGVEIDPKLFKGKRILLAEDNDLNAEIAIEILGEAGFVVERAEDGAICCEKMKKAGEKSFDLVLMDIQMPNMNGYEATRTIRQMQNTVKSNIPIIAMTANAFEEDKREAFRAGMNGHVTKPINVTELMKTLAGILN